MPYVDRPLPETLVLPRLVKKPRDKRLDNLRHDGRVRGVKNKITRDLKEGVLTAAINVGRDGHGTDGLIGFLEDLAMYHKKAFCSLLVKMLPLQVSADVSASTVQFNIVSVPTDHYFVPNASDGPGVSGVFEHIPPSEPIAPTEPEPKLAALEARLASMPYEKLLALAGVTDEDARTLIKLIVDRLVRLLLEHEPKASAPEPPPEPEPRKLRQSERPGISMNELARSVPRPKPPRKPSWERW